MQGRWRSILVTFGLTGWTDGLESWRCLESWWRFNLDVITWRYADIHAYCRSLYRKKVSYWNLKTVAFKMCNLTVALFSTWCPNFFLALKCHDSRHRDFSYYRPSATCHIGYIWSGNAIGINDYHYFRSTSGQTSDKKFTPKKIYCTKRCALKF